MSDPQAIDLTTFAADAPLPADQNHPIYNYEIPEGPAQVYDPQRFMMLEMRVMQALRTIQHLTQKVEMIMTRESK